jgi:hypothetical protein
MVTMFSAQTWLFGWQFEAAIVVVVLLDKVVEIGFVTAQLGRGSSARTPV